MSKLPLPPPTESIKQDSFAVKTAQVILAIVCFVLASLPSLYIAHIGAYLFDETYQILNSLDYKNTPIAPLSNYFGYLFGSTFGWEWIKFRYLAFGLHKIAILIGGYYMWHKTKQYWLSLSTTCAALLISSLFSFSQNLYGWDSWTLPLIVCSLIAIIEYIESRKDWLIVVLAILSTLAGLCRIPNFSIVVIISAILFYQGKNELQLKNKVKSTALYLGITIIAAITLITLLYGSPQMYLTYLKANSIESHGISKIIVAFTSGLFSFLHFPALIWCCYLAMNKAYQKNTYLYFIVSIFALCAMYYVLLICHTDFGFINVQDYLIGLNLILILAILFYNKKLSNVIIAIVLISCVPLIGSNTGIIKFVTLPLLPILYVFARKYITKSMRMFGVIYFLALMLYSYNGVRHSSFFDVGIIEAKYEIKADLAKQIKTTESKGKFIDEVYDNIKPYCNYHKIVLRRDFDYVYEYLLQSRNGYLRHRFNGADDNDADYVSWVKDEIANNGEKVAILRFGDSNEPSLMTDALNKLCTKIKVTDRYTIYLKNTDSHE
jgi:branched-subunit amino acid transport protein